MKQDRFPNEKNAQMSHGSNTPLINIDGGLRCSKP